MAQNEMIWRSTTLGLFLTFRGADAFKFLPKKLFMSEDWGKLQQKSKILNMEWHSKEHTCQSYLVKSSIYILQKHKKINPLEKKKNYFNHTNLNKYQKKEKKNYVKNLDRQMEYTIDN